MNIILVQYNGFDLNVKNCFKKKLIDKLGYIWTTILWVYTNRLDKFSKVHKYLSYLISLIKMVLIIIMSTLCQIRKNPNLQ